MASVNKVILIGNLGKDPAVEQTPSGTSRCRFTLATSENFTDREGQRQERTEWHNIVIWGKLADVAGQYLKKGRPVYIEGRITYRTYQDQSGATKYFTEIVATGMQLLGGRPDQQSSDSGVPPPDEPYAAPQKSRGSSPQRQQAQPEMPEDGAPADNDEDLPF